MSDNDIFDVGASFTGGVDVELTQDDGIPVSVPTENGSILRLRLKRSSGADLVYRLGVRVQEGGKQGRAMFVTPSGTSCVSNIYPEGEVFEVIDVEVENV